MSSEPKRAPRGIVVLDVDAAKMRTYIEKLRKDADSFETKRKAAQATEGASPIDLLGCIMLHQAAAQLRLASESLDYIAILAETM